MDDTSLLTEIASKLELQEYLKGGIIFEEKQPGEHFFMILDGDVSIVKMFKNEDGKIIETITLVKLFRGQSFGDTALETKGGLRSAGAVASTKAYLLALHADDYQLVRFMVQAQVQQEEFDHMPHPLIFMSSCVVWCLRIG